MRPHIPIGAPVFSRTTSISPRPCFSYDAMGPFSRYFTACSSVRTPRSAMFSMKDGSLRRRSANGASSTVKRRMISRGVEIMRLDGLEELRVGVVLRDRLEQPLHRLDRL